LDLFIKYDTDVGNGTLSTGLEANAILGYLSQIIMLAEH